MTVAGSVVQNCAEVLAHVVLCQVVKPGHPSDDDPVQRAPATWRPASPRWRRRRPTSSAPPACSSARRASASRVSGCPIMTDTYVTDGRAVAEKALGGLHERHGRHGHRLRRRPAGRRQPRQPRPARDRRPARSRLLKEYVRRRAGGRRLPGHRRDRSAAGIGGSFVQSKHTLRHCRDYVEPSLFRFQLQQHVGGRGREGPLRARVDEYRAPQVRDQAGRPARTTCGATWTPSSPAPTRRCAQ